MSDNEAAAPEVKPEQSHISLKIQGAGFPDLMIKVKKTTKLQKMMTAYCDRAGKQMSEVRFMFEGQKIKPEHTISDFDIEEDDEEIVIDVTSEAVGGSA